MEIVTSLYGVLIGLLGWAATGLWILNAPRLSEIDRRLMILCMWLIWMIPGLGTLVRDGLLSITSFVIICSLSTVFWGILLFAAHLVQSRE
jgi:hypothetical protein